MKMGKSEIKILIIYIGRQNMRYQQWNLSKYFALPYSHPMPWLSVISRICPPLYNFLQFFAYEF